MLIDLTVNWSRKGDSDSRKETGGDGFPTGELDRALAASSPELLKKIIRANCFSLWVLIHIQ
jgi:hypothetical protein